VREGKGREGKGREGNDDRACRVRDKKGNEGEKKGIWATPPRSSSSNNGSQILSKLSVTWQRLEVGGGDTQTLVYEMLGADVVGLGGLGTHGTNWGLPCLALP
jgi:hypothetical protein